MPNRSTFSRYIIPNNFKEERQKVFDILKNDNYDSPAIISDIWTSRANDAYKCFTCHYLNSEFILRHFVLTTVAFPESHTAANIMVKMDEVLDSFDINLSEKKLFFVSDSGSNYVSAKSQIADIVDSVTCFGHNLHLAVNDAIKSNTDIHNMLKNGSSMVAFHNRSSKTYANLFENQKKNRMALGLH